MYEHNVYESTIDHIKLANQVLQDAQRFQQAGDREEALRMYDFGINLIIHAQIMEFIPKSMEIQLSQLAIKAMEESDKLRKELAPLSDGVQDSSGVESEEDNRLAKQLAATVVMESPNVSWSDVAGLEAAKTALREAVILPLKFPQLFEGSSRKPWSGILMYGPPGTGKSFLAKAAATEAGGVSFFSVSSSNLMSRWQGESERLVRGLFDLARKRKPSIIFIDEVDSILSQRGGGTDDSSSRVKTEFLVQMQGVGNNNSGILVLAATNLPWAIDEAARRRFERRIYIPLPDVAARLTMIKNGLAGTQHELVEDEMVQLAQAIDGFSGSDISTLIQAALMKPVERIQKSKWFKRTVKGIELAEPEEPGAFESDFFALPSNVVVPAVTLEDVKAALNSTKPTVDKTQLARFEEWTREFGQVGG